MEIYEGVKRVMSSDLSEGSSNDRPGLFIKTPRSFCPKNNLRLKLN